MRERVCGSRGCSEPADESAGQFGRLCAAHDKDIRPARSRALRLDDDLRGPDPLICAAQSLARAIAAESQAEPVRVGALPPLMAGLSKPTRAVVVSVAARLGLIEQMKQGYTAGPVKPPPAPDEPLQTPAPEPEPPEIKPEPAPTPKRPVINGRGQRQALEAQARAEALAAQIGPWILECAPVSRAEVERFWGSGKPTHRALLLLVDRGVIVSKPGAGRGYWPATDDDE